MWGKMSMVTRPVHWSSVRPQSSEPREAASVTVREPGVTELVSRNLCTRVVAVEGDSGCLGVEGEVQVQEEHEAPAEERDAVERVPGQVDEVGVGLGHGGQQGVQQHQLGAAQGGVAGGGGRWSEWR